MKLSGIKCWAIVLFVVSAIQVAVVSCSDDPGVENYYTQSREYASDYLKNREQYSEYLKILERARGEYDLRLVDMLGTYGSYTIFAPTNEAVEKYLAGRTVEDLSVEECDTIALNSIIEATYFTTDHNSGQYPKSNMLGRVLTVLSSMKWDATKQDSVLALCVNQTSDITHADDSVANGVIHTVNTIVATSSELIGQVILRDPKCSLYASALEITGLIDTLNDHYIDPDYGWASAKDRLDSCTWTNDALVRGTAFNPSNNKYNEYENVAFTEKRFFNYTVFMCPDSILKADYGIETLDDLRAKARELYEPVYPEDANVTDETDRRNYLNRFISYHILDRYGDYYSLTFFDGHPETRFMFDRDHYDICDWYETLMPYSMMKCSYPDGRTTGLYINRRGVCNHIDERGGFERGARVFRPEEYNGVSQTGLNGIYHYIDRIVAYDRTMQNVVMDDCIRLDCTTLSPDFMTKIHDGETPRGHSDRDGNKYNTDYTTAGQPARNNTNRSVAFKRGFVRNFELRGKTLMHVRTRTMYFGCYEADEVLFKGVYDFTVKLPPVPVGTYEVRMGCTVDFPSRGIIQVYLDDQPQGIPFDMRKSGPQLFGYKSDSDLGDNDAITAFDKAIHNLQWMKAPKCYMPGERTSKQSANSLRDAASAVRRVFGTIVSDGKTDHYLRIQQKMDSDNNELPFDYIELCPSSVYNNEYYAEPVW
jgi:uncharacterized surface protein with fasciclin (FAS1) repeats